MYADPSKIRDNVVKVRLNDAELKVLEALTRYTGEQKAALMRELILAKATEIFADLYNK
jgi:predicted DNA-binding protein